MEITIANSNHTAYISMVVKKWETQSCQGFLLYVVPKQGSQQSVRASPDLGLDWPGVGQPTGGVNERVFMTP